MKNRIAYSCICMVLGATAIAGCGTEEIADTPENGDAIRFNAVVANRSRAVPTTTSSIKEFTVYAFTQNSMLMNGVQVTREGGQWVYSPQAYWPTSPVNFYAYSPEINNSPNITGGEGGNIPGYLNDGTVDLLYSTKIGVSQHSAPVNLNFRHAMANVNVLLSSTNTRIQVKVSHVLVNNVYIKGTFDFPQQSTDASSPGVTGTWSMLQNLDRMLFFYALSPDDEVTLTSLPTNYAIGNLNVGFVIPQPLIDVSLENGVYAGSYIAVECEIFDTATGAKLWPNSNTPDYMLVDQTELGRIVYPVVSPNVTEWLPGHAYNYNITINNPSVLDKIEFDVTVDEYNVDEM